CPLWVISGHFVKSGRCPLYPQKRTLVERVGMSALCQKQTFKVLGRAARSGERPGLTELVLNFDTCSRLIAAWHFVLGIAVVLLAVLELRQDWNLSRGELTHHSAR